MIKAEPTCLFIQIPGFIKTLLCRKHFRRDKREAYYRLGRIKSRLSVFHKMINSFAACWKILKYNKADFKNRTTLVCSYKYKSALTEIITDTNSVMS